LIPKIRDRTNLGTNPQLKLKNSRTISDFENFGYPSPAPHTSQYGGTAQGVGKAWQADDWFGRA